MLYRGDVIGEHCVYSPKRKSTVTCRTFSEFYILPISEIIGVAAFSLSLSLWKVP